MTDNIPQQSSFDQGIDVSRWQGQIDWSKVAAAGVRHAMAKMTEGGDYTDKTFLANFKGMKANAIQAGGYHYYRALSSTPAQQLANIHGRLSDCQFDVAGDLLAIDVELDGNEKATPDQMADRLYELINLIKESVLNGRAPYIYTSPSVWTEHVAWQKYDFSDCPLWIAHWDAAQPRIPETWLKQDKSWQWWQHSNRGTVDGIAGDVDLNWVKEIQAKTQAKT